MNFPGISEIKKELQLLPPKRLQELCLRMAKYKKENKELLAFLIFESDNKDVFVGELKSELRAEFVALASQNNLFYLKKGLRRLLRLLNRYMKYIDDKALAADLLIFFCRQIVEQGIPVHRSLQLKNLYEQQLKKIGTCISSLHEDLQQDYLAELEKLR